MATPNKRNIRPTYGHTPGSGRPNPTGRTELTNAFRGDVNLPSRTLPAPSTAATTIINQVGSGCDCESIPGPAGSIIYSGSSAPSGTLGVDGDYYFNVDNGDFYKKSGGIWSFLRTLIGPNYPIKNAAGTNVSTAPTSLKFVGAATTAVGNDVTVTVTPYSPPTGTDTQTLRYNGTSLVANSILTNDGAVVGIGGLTGVAPITFTPATPAINVKDASAAAEHYLISGEVNLGRKFGLYKEADGNEGGFKADSQFTMKSNNGLVFKPSTSSTTVLIANGSNVQWNTFNGGIMAFGGPDENRRLQAMSNFIPYNSSLPSLAIGVVTAQTANALTVRADASTYTAVSGASSSGTLLAAIDKSGFGLFSGFKSLAVGTPTLRARTIASQTANVLQVEDVPGTSILAYIDNAGIAKTAGYRSSDGSNGLTTTLDYTQTGTFKNGILTAVGAGTALPDEYNTEVVKYVVADYTIGLDEQFIIVSTANSIGMASPVGAD